MAVQPLLLNALLPYEVVEALVLARSGWQALGKVLPPDVVLLRQGALQDLDVRSDRWVDAKDDPAILDELVPYGCHRIPFIVCEGCGCPSLKSRRV